MKDPIKKALSYESFFGIPVEIISPDICHPEVFTLYHIMPYLSSTRTSQIKPWRGPDGIRTRTFWVTTRETTIILPAQIQAREVSVYHEPR